MQCSLPPLIKIFPLARLETLVYRECVAQLVKTAPSFPFGAFVRRVYARTRSSGDLEYGVSFHQPCEHWILQGPMWKTLCLGSFG